MKQLEESDIEERLGRLSGWERKGDWIRREYRFGDFAASMAFVNRVAALAEEADHHPDIDIRYDKVKLGLSTHSAGGLTTRDFDLAARIDAAAGA
ncbi:MAG TPA: 4a-hydroxytetrahydrobiopterin dehydratase [Longimicrobiales bacterium]|nr:4a-hydroxytetrahydrobiopterin dehydratase [Longimicrobiales bacterium]